MSVISDFITNTVERLLDISDIKLDDISQQLLQEFVHDSESLTLQACLNNEDKLVLYKNVQGNHKKSIIFYKTCPRDLTVKNSLAYINVVTLSTSVVESLYQALRQIYSPLFVSGNDLYSSKLQKNLLELESNLRILTYGKEEGNTNIILTIEDEVNYWKTIGQKIDANKKDREAASAFCVLFEDVSEEIRSIQTSVLPDVRDSVENIAGILDDIWRYTEKLYAQERMTHVFDIVGHIVCSILQKTISGEGLFVIQNGIKDNEILIILSHALHVIQTWISACQSLTGMYWSNYALHSWKGDPYIPSFCINFEVRIKEIYNIMSTFNQLSKLLTNSEKSELRVERLFEPFQNINIWIINGPNKPWENAVAQFSANLRPAESKLAEKLKPRMHNTSTKQMLYEFMRYKTLINRPVVKAALSNELELFVSSLLSMLKTIQSHLDSNDTDVKMFQPAEMSPLVHQVQWAKQMEAKVKEIQSCTETYLIEYEKSSELMAVSSKVLKDLKTMYTQLHEEWCRELQSEIKAGSLQLCVDKPVVSFSAASRLLQVNFNPRVEVWRGEARALAALGLPAPAASRALAALAALVPHARALTQVASFHNTLGERMIPSTRPMMLQAALDLSALVQEQKPVYWNDEEQLTNYTEKLKKMVLKLEMQNTYLTGQHIAIRNIVEKLMDTELLAQQTQWKKSIKEIRDIIDKVEANGYKNTEMWRSHWDVQLYKALECQYIKALLSLHTHFPTVKVDLVFRGHMVRLQPPMEEIRTQHYSQLRRLVSMPAQFVGLQNTLTENESIFATIVEKHGWVGNKAVGAVEAALAALERARTRWARRAAQSPLEHAATPQHWEEQFKHCKAYGQAVAKMSFDDEKIHWIIVSTVSLRREFEAQARNLWSSLMTSLQGSCREDTETLESFIAGVVLLIEDKALPKNAKELSEISAKQQSVQAKLPEMEKLVDDLKRKGHMLRTWGGDYTIDHTVKEWLRIREQLHDQRELFEHQAEVVKSGLRGEWESLTNSVEGWVGHWEASRSRPADNTLSYTMLVKRAREIIAATADCDRFIAEREVLKEECQKFNLTLEITEIWSEAENLKTEFINRWSILLDYNEAYETLASQDWILFQKKLHQLDEFISHWNGKLEPYTPVTLIIKQELDKYEDLTPALKYLRGSEFTETHWREIFSLLEMEIRKPETLTLKEFLDVSLQIKKHIKALQKISSRASSEAAISSTLREIELWFAGARFTIIYHKDTAKRSVPIVKDYKDILNKVEEQQWAAAAGGTAAAASATRLRAAADIARAAHRAQRRWLYLEPILSNDDGDLGAKFRKVDLAFRQVARIFESDPRLSALVQSTRIQPMLDSILDQLNNCQSALNEYIDEKRFVFPRLYFLSDDDLLELLGQARAGTEGMEVIMQSHLKKLFPGITGVRLGPSNLSITALCSHYDEVFQLDHPINVDCPVEVWLKNLENEIRSSLKNVTIKCLTAKDSQDKDPFSLPTQILCLAQNIRFTEQVEKAIADKDLHRLKDGYEKETLYYSEGEDEEEKEKHKRQALILQCDYYVLVIQSLIENNIVSVNDWFWQKQLRFYFLNKEEVIAKMGLAQISYSYEYLGTETGQFVRTDVTDDCFLILTQSLHLGLVGNPFGPAGTGKTESVKALGGLFGRLVLVFNCDEAMDPQCMGRLLAGLALCGAWGCFDEFNRLSADTLAAVAHHLAALMAATADNPVALLNGKQVQVSAWCYVAATMNPAGRGYGGRRRLPAALAPLLQPLALRPPARIALAARLLAAHNHPALAPALDQVFQLASTLLSDERHYDWGLRALKATVGSLSGALAGRPAGAPLAALRHVLRRNHRSKLTAHDAARFENILSMVFAGIPEEESPEDPLLAALASSVKQLNLIHNKSQIQKCMELYEQMQQRMGVAIVGPPCSGKTTIRKLLKTALCQQGENIVEYVIYPKAMSRSCLLGQIDHDTRQWTDGVISAVAIEASNQPPEVWSWMVMVGDVEPSWVEALNSALDDNRLLTLASGARVRLPRRFTLLLHTHTLASASPATITRLAVILLSDDYSCAQEFFECWMQNADSLDEIAKMAIPYLKQTIQKILEWLMKHKSDVVVKNYDTTMVRQILSQFEYIVQDINSRSAYSTTEDIIHLALERSVTGVIKENALDKFYEAVTDGMRASLVDVAYPKDGTFSEGGDDVLLLGKRLQTCAMTLKAALLGGHDVLIVGPDGCAKSLLAEHVLKECNYTVITIECTPILEPSDIIAEMKRNNALRSSGPSASNTGVILFVRALHRARVDEWGSRPVHDFLRQVSRGCGVWEGGAARRGAGARVLATAWTAHALCPRLAAHLALVTLPEPDEHELIHISNHHLRENSSKNVTDEEILNLSKNIVHLYNDVIETFNIHSHYKWNPSHLQTMCQNVKWYSPTNVTEMSMAVIAEAKMTFRERLVTDEEKLQYDSLVRNYLKHEGGDIYYKPKTRGDGVYLEACDHNEWTLSMQKLINQCLTDDEHVFGDTGVEVYDELAVLCPALAISMNGGTAVCVGSAGVGRAAAAYLVAAALPAAVLRVRDEDELQHTLKNALSSCEAGRRVAVLVEAAAAAAALPALEPAADTQQQSQPMHDIKQNLGIMICLDKNHEGLLELMEQYPLLYNTTRLVWIDKWSEDTLRKLPTLILQRLMRENAMEISKEDLSTIPVDGFVNIFKTVQSEHLRAPCRYINFIKSYFYIMTKKKDYLLQRKNTLSAGVEALRRARSEVATLQKEAAQQEIAFTEEQTKANQALDQIGATVRATTDKKEEMHRLKKNIEIENEKLQKRKKEIEDELAAVEPVIAAARAAVGDIRPESLSEIRSLRAPPDVVRDVLEGVLRLMGIADTSWHSMKHFLSKRGVKEDIRRLDAESVSPEAVAAVAALVERRGASFSESVARRASAAAAPLAAWVRANLAHARATAAVRPLRAEQLRLQRNLKEAEGELEALSSGLTTVEERVGALKEQLGRHTKEAAALELRLTTVTKTIATATDLLAQLAHEYDAWELDLENISKEILELTQRSLLAAGYIVYLPDLTEPQAKTILVNWCSIIGYEETSFSVIDFLSTPEKQLKWENDGLSSDQSALKNAVVIDQFLKSQKCGFTPLIFDPEGEAEAWLRNTLKDTPCDFISQHSDKLQTVLQYAARLSRVVVMTEVEESEGRWWVWCGARVVLVCRAAPRRRPPARRRAALAEIHFAARLHSLQDQLVHYAIQKQNPSMNKRYKEIKIQKFVLQKQQHELQENLLKDLSNNRDILHDENLLASLKKTRSTSATITEALEAARVIEKEMEDACTAYEAYAHRTARLTLAVKQLATQKPLVTLPIDAIQEVFVDAINRAKDSKNISNDEVVKYITRTVIDRVLLSLHKNEKYIVILHLLRQVYDDVIPDSLWKIFIGHISMVDDKNTINLLKGQYQWINAENLSVLAQLKIQHEDLFKRLSLENAELWSEFLDTGNLHLVKKLKLSAFETVVAVAALRPQSVYRAIVTLVDDMLGGGGARARAALGAAAGAGRVVLLAGAHAAHELQAHAEAAARSLVTVPVEEGYNAWQEALDKSRTGGWLAIIVGASPFTRELQTFITEISQRANTDLHEDFRLWIITEEREIPSNIANSCVNVILEAPMGVKANVCGTLAAWGPERGEPARMRYLASLALFHAVAQERRQYIPQGWSQWYEWGWGSLRAARAGGAALAGALYGAHVPAAAAADATALAALAARLRRAAHPLHPNDPKKQLPLAHDLHAYLEIFDTLPEIDTPDILGLPDNCRVAWEKNAADSIVEGLRELDTTAITKKSDDSAASIKAILSLWKKLMSGNPLLKADYAAEVGGRGWWAAASAGEARDAARAARALHAALAAAARAHTHSNLHKVPDEWQLLWSGPDHPETYLKEFCYRARAAVDRLKELDGKGNDFFPKEVDLRTFLRPERVLSSLVAHEATKRGCSADRLALVPAWGDDALDESGAGVLVCGLQVSGAAWARARLRPAPPLAAAAAPAPPLRLAALPAETEAEAGSGRGGGAWRVGVFSGARCVARLAAPLGAELSRERADLAAVALHVAPLA